MFKGFQAAKSVERIAVRLFLVGELPLNVWHRLNWLLTLLLLATLFRQRLVLLFDGPLILKLPEHVRL